MVVQHNILAINSNRQLNITTKAQAKSTEKLSSGYKINRAADDAAGLSISEKMRKQIRGLSQASTNAEDGISMVQIADGALEEVHAMLQRGNELCVQAANGTNSESDRQAIQDEIDQLNKEIDRISQTTKFNETYLFPTEDINSTSSSSTTLALDTYKVVYRPEDGSITITKTASADAKEGVSGESTTLSDKIATELFPNAIAQITSAFPALETNGFSIDLKIGYIDGTGSSSGDTQAFASASIGVRNSGSGKYAYATDFSFTVDADNFSDADATGTGANAGALEATIAHEMVHSLMYANFPAEMSTESTTGSTEIKPDGSGTTAANDAVFPSWFKEGVAQLAGGGLSSDAGWNNGLVNLINAGGSDSDITDYLGTHYTTDNEINYGLGYLAAAYLGQLVSGSATVTNTSISGGINTLLNYIKENDVSLDQAIGHFVSGKTASSILSDLKDGTATTFVKKLVAASTTGGVTGNGSVIAASLTASGTDLLNSTATIKSLNSGGKSYAVNVILNMAEELTPKDIINLHVGTDADMTNKIGVKLYGVSSKSVGTKSVNVTTEDGATSGITNYGEAISYVSSMRSYYGAIQNRLEHTINNLDNVVENTTSAESRIRDTDMAEEMVEYSKNNILAQAGQSMLAQANQSTQGVMNLLR